MDPACLWCCPEGGSAVRCVTLASCLTCNRRHRLIEMLFAVYFLKPTHTLFFTLIPWRWRLCDCLSLYFRPTDFWCRSSKRRLKVREDSFLPPQTNKKTFLPPSSNCTNIFHRTEDQTILQNSSLAWFREFINIYNRESHLHLRQVRSTVCLVWYYFGQCVKKETFYEALGTGSQRWCKRTLYVMGFKRRTCRLAQRLHCLLVWL